MCRKNEKHWTTTVSPKIRTNVQERSGRPRIRWGGMKFIFKDWNKLSNLNLGIFRRRIKVP